MPDSNNPAFPDFGKLVPGFDFLQNLTRQASTAAQSVPAMPQLSSWVAPTLNVEELDKRIQELKAVQFWLDQNATALKATIQALEVQKMTLATLEGMNVSMNQMAEAFSIKPADAQAAKPHHFDGLEVPETSYQKKDTARADSAAAGKAAPSGKAFVEADAPSQDPAVPGLIDPLQWWGALTQQFQTIANSAMKEVAARTPVGTDDGLAQGMKAATDMAEQAGQRLAKTASDATEMMSSAMRGEQPWPLPGNGAVKKGRASTAGKATSKASSAGAKASAKTSAKTPAKAGAKKTSTSRPTAAKAPAARKGAARTR